jgi:hypothetical protein
MKTGEPQPRRGIGRLIDVAFSVNDRVHPKGAYVFKGALHHIVHAHPLCPACRVDLLDMVAQEEAEPHLASIARDLIAHGDQFESRAVNDDRDALRAEINRLVSGQYDVYAAAREEYRTKIGEQAAEIEGLRTALREVEWGGLTDALPGGFVAACPFCDAEREKGVHNDGCRLAAALRRGKLFPDSGKELPRTDRETENKGEPA